MTLLAALGTAVAVAGAGWLLVVAAVTLWIRPPPPSRPRATVGADRTPPVLVQLPIYDEGDQVAGLLESAAALAWPDLRIQLLDDSSPREAEANAALAARHPRVTVVRRPRREHYKAGALAWGLQADDAPFAAVFDADFRPAPDDVARLMRRFHGDRVGAVQGRVVARNRGHSWLTRAQAAGVDLLAAACASADGAGFVPFWGTAGVWRREAIAAGGGWSGDTVCEDLDLSVRTHLAGWTIAYDETIRVTSQLPTRLSDLAAQQRRWARGEAQTLRKLAPAILAQAGPWSRRLELIGALLGYSFMPALCAALGGSAVAGLAAPEGTVAVTAAALGLVVWGGATVISMLRATRWNGADPTVRDALGYVLLGVALCWTVGLAVLHGYLGRSAAFLRTSKATFAPDPRGLLLAQALGAALALTAAAAPWRGLPLPAWWVVCGVAWGGVAAVALAPSAGRARVREGRPHERP